METNKNGNENGRKNNQSGTNDRIKDAERNTKNSAETSWRENERKEQEWDTYGFGYEHSIGNTGVATEKRKKNETENKSVHVEDWENDPFEYHSEGDDVRGEFEVRSENTETNKEDSNKEDPDGYTTGTQRWKSGGESTDEHNGRNDNRKSGTDETLGVP